jgi:intracellular multiplication protein IcmJ
VRYHPITLGVNRTNWSKKNISNPGVSDADLDKARKKIFIRDENTCQCCGFKSEKYQLVLYIDGDARNVSDQNCLTTCPFCHQCFDLSQVEKLQSGMLIWLPEIGQAALHHIMRALYIARVTQGPLAVAARSTIDEFYERADEARKRLGSSDPAALALVLHDFLSHKQYEKAAEQLRGIRLLPLDRRMVTQDGLEINQFAEMLAYWRGKNGPFANFNPKDWPALIAKEMRNVA